MKCFFKVSIILTLFSNQLMLPSSSSETVQQPTNDTPQVIHYTPDSAHSIPNSSDTVIKIIDVIHNAKHSLSQHKSDNFNQLLTELFEHLTRPFSQENPINQDIHDARQAIVKSTQAVRSLISMKTQGRNITTGDVYDELRKAGYQINGDRASVVQVKKSYDLFAQTVFPACYQPIVERNLHGWTTKELQIKTFQTNDTTAQEIFKHQVINILNKLHALWSITLMLFSDEQNIQIALQYPQAIMSIPDWAKLTHAAEIKLQNTTEIGKEVQATQANIAQEMKALLTRAIEEKAEIAKLENVTRNFSIVAAAAREKMQEEHVQDLENIATQAKTEHATIVKTEKIAILPQNLQTAQKLIDSFEDCKKYHNYKHLLFSKHNISAQIQTTLDTLKQLLSLLISTNSTAQTMAKTEFKQQMNALYSFLFKKEYAPGSTVLRTPDFLCFKHKFDALAANLTEQEAVPAVASLVILWEIYKNLPTDSGTESVELPYLNKTQTVDEWISDTRNCGFKEYGTFSLPLAPGRPSHLDTALSLCSPKKEPSFFDRSIQSATNALNSIGGWFSSTWSRLTAKSRSIVDEPDTI